MELIAAGIALWRNAFEIEDGFAEEYFAYRFEQSRGVSWRGDKALVKENLMHYESGASPLRVGNHSLDETFTESNKYDSYSLYLHKVLMKGLKDYLKTYPVLQKDIHFIENYRLVYYQPGDYMRLHSDQSWSGNEGRSEPADLIENENGLRTICCIQHLSSSSDGEDPEWGEFDGGEVSWPYVTDKSFMPQQGDMLIYPANFLYSHQVDRVLSGHRISNLVCIGHGKIPPRVKPLGPLGYEYLDFKDEKIDWKGW